jgi:cytochrome P450
MAACTRIQDFDDSGFDPFRTFDEAQGFGEVEDPFPRIHELHRQATVHCGDLREQFGLKPFPIWDDIPSVFVMGYPLVERVYGDAATFSNAVMRRIYDKSFGASINGMDAPEHALYRRLFQRAFMPLKVADWGGRLVPAVIQRTIEPFARRGKAELVSEFTIKYPFDVVYGQLELPPEDLQAFHRLAVGLMCITVDFPHAAEASRKMGNYFQLLLQERRAAPGEDLIGLLAQAEIEGERIPDEVTVSFLRQLMNAAGDTTYRSTGSLLVGLLTHPGQLEALRADRSLVPRAVEEALRWDGPLTLLTRQASRDVVLDGIEVPAGTKVDVVAGSANRDPDRYERPDEFDIHRPPSRHMAFAFGPHVCLGQHLARLEMSRALNALLDNLPNLRLDPDYPVPTVTGLNSRAPRAVHVLFDPH